MPDPFEESCPWELLDRASVAPSLRDVTPDARRE
jgi:hypothetical protein